MQQIYLAKIRPTWKCVLEGTRKQYFRANTEAKGIRTRNVKHRGKTHLARKGPTPRAKVGQRKEVIETGCKVKGK